jgi:hypothetical protein
MFSNANHPAHRVDRSAFGNRCENENALGVWDSVVAHALIYSTRFQLAQQKSLDIFKPMKKKTHGGKRAGAGRPSEGKTRYNVMLNTGNVTTAKKREKNFSGLIDRLLADWIER